MNFNPWVDSNNVIENLKDIRWHHIDREFRKISVTRRVVIRVRCRREVCRAYWHSEISEPCAHAAFGRVEKIIQQASVCRRVIGLGGETEGKEWEGSSISRDTEPTELEV